MRKRFTLALLSLLLVPLAMMAQDVTISPSTGSLMAALTQEGESGSAAGNSSTWKHNQLALTLTVADFGNITAGGEIANPAGNMNTNSNNELTICGGNSPDVYMGVSLPKGYRFTSYEIVIANNINDRTANGRNRPAQQKIFYETSDLLYLAGTTDMDYNNNDDYRYFTQINTAIGNNDSHYLAVARSKSSNSYVMRGANEDNEADFYVISRTSLAEDGSDMGNHLYFRLSHRDNAGVGITLKSARFYFTAEGDFTEQVSPKAEATSVTTTGVNYMYAPFTTGKLDLGDVSLDANGHYTYKYFNVRDLEANNVIYQADAVSNGALPATAGAGGIFGVYNNSNYYYGLKNNTYYVETPISAPTTAGANNDSPIGFRITGAKVHYAYGIDATGGSEPVYKDFDQFTISADVTSGGIFSTTTTYYINSNGGATTYSSQAALWFMDDDGYIRTGENGQTYLASNNSYLTTTTNSSSAIACEFYGGNIRQKGTTNQWLRYSPSSYYNLDFRFQNNTGNRVAAAQNGKQAHIQVGTVSVPAFTAKPYTLTVYEKDGTTVHGSAISVNSTNTSGTVELTGLNNDAIKFKVEGLQGDDAKALITVELTMQALDPYIDQMTVVCQDKAEGKESIRIKQGFYASDFSVNGGEFHFFLPSSCVNDQVQITFEELYSHYGDQSYTKARDGFDGSATHFSRFNFVKSEHFNAFGTTTNNLYSNYSEAANPQLNRVNVATVGDKAFKFNNAADVSGGSATHFIEYPFSLEAYTAADGSFDELVFTVSSENQRETRYVFTTDETAYNIAPTTATQHRVYAFYTMVVNVKSDTYDPKVEFKPIYSETLYGTGQNDAFYGAVITATDGDGNPGYSSTDEIFQLIEKAINEDKQDSFGHTDIPDNANKLLYLDFSQLAGVYQTTQSHGSMEEFGNTNAKNCIIFVPKGAAAPVDNVASKTETGFRAARNIVLTDKEPFYTPYNISVDAAQKVEYKRAVTYDKYGNVQNLSLILPFIISVDEGVHTNLDGTQFTLHTLQTSDAISKDEESTFAYFPRLVDVTVTTANTPYLVKLPDGTSEGQMVVSQSGSTIYASTSMASDYTFSGNPSSGMGYSFTSKGTYAGQSVPKTNNIFYFANNQFVCSADYKYNAPIKIAPFRAYFATGGNGEANLHLLNVVFGENPGGETDGIDAMSADVDVDVNAPVFDLQGRKVADGLQNAHLVRGIYVINGVKVIVK